MPTHMLSNRGNTLSHLWDTRTWHTEPTHNLYASSTETSSTRKKTGHKMVPLCELRKKCGVAIADAILADKRAKETNKAAGDTTRYFMEHPECPGKEESCTFKCKTLCILLLYTSHQTPQFMFPAASVSLVQPGHLWQPEMDNDV